MLRRVQRRIAGEDAGELPPEVLSPFAGVLGVSSAYFFEQQAAIDGDAALLKQLLSDCGVRDAWICRTAPSVERHTTICVNLLEIARAYCEE